MVFSPSQGGRLELHRQTGGPRGQSGLRRRPEREEGERNNEGRIFLRGEIRVAH